MKRGKFSEFRTAVIASASLSGTVEQTLVRRSPGLPDLFHCLLLNCYLLLTSATV